MSAPDPAGTTPPPGYFDAASGLPLHPVAAQAQAAAEADGWADPTRLSAPGRRSAVLLNAAREAVATEFDARPDEVYFVASGPFALQLAVLGSLAGRSRVGRRLVMSAVEHSAVFKAADWHREQGGIVDVVGVDELGRVDTAVLRAQIRRPGTATTVVQAANHEVGTRQPLAEIDSWWPDGLPLVVDAGHSIRFDPPPRAPIVTADARLWGGPAGVGVLVVRRGTRWRSPFPLETATNGPAVGVPNVPAIVGAAAALRAVRAERETDAVQLHGLIEKIRTEVASRVPDVVVLGDPLDRLPHIVTFSGLYVDGESILTALDRTGFTVSSGSSCTSDTLTPSHVLVAMGAPTGGNVRVSLHPGVTEAEVEQFLAVLPEVFASARAELPGRDTSPTTAPGSNPTDHHGDPDAELDTPPDRVVDSRGRRCPLPVLDLARALPSVPIGHQIELRADDPAAGPDIAAWCRLRGQELLGSTRDGPNEQSFRVRRLQ